MTTVFYVFAMAVHIFIYFEYMAMFLRAIFSWFPNAEDSKIYHLSILVTEPIISPVRKVMERFNIGQGMPVDLSFFVTMLLLLVLRLILPLPTL